MEMITSKEERSFEGLSGLQRQSQLHMKGQTMSFLGVNFSDPTPTPDLNNLGKQEKLKEESSKLKKKLQMQQKHDLLDERLKAIEGMDIYGSIDAIDYLTGAIAKWYVQLDRNRIHTWKDLARAFVAKYKHVLDMARDRFSLQNMEKRDTESFKEYAQRWRDVAAQVQPPFIEKETIMFFISTLPSPYHDRLIENVTKNFTDIVISREMIENAIKKGKIKENNVNSMENCNASKKRRREARVITCEEQPWGINPYHLHSAYQPSYPARNHISHSLYPYQPIPQPIFHLRAPTPPLMPQSLPKPNLRQLPMPISKLLPILIENQYLSLVPMKTISNPSARNYDANAKCDYHMGAIGHLTEKCRQLKEKIENLIRDGSFTLELMECWK
ncbi:Gag-pro-like protein [Theobroma cacao]|uniref:Gag-pro-like protein n=1 Tax=Theobroma cacao TaxID=3641 RepID=A0A061EGE1_THECC|nr:Gag-pro-like protein [Theobroma cacao]